MRIDLTNYNATATSKFRIYRSYSTFTEDNLPPMLVELPAETESYLDNTVALNRLVYYRISVVHNQSEIVGPIYTEMKKYYTGPQVNTSNLEPDTILRGNAQIGRYGTLPISSVYPVDQITTDFPAFPWVPEVDHQNMLVEKCIFDNKILFITDAPIIQGSLEELYNAGVLFTTGDGVDELDPVLYGSITTKVQQGKKIHAAGFTYRFRLITESEFQQLYTKLYPASVLGSKQDKVIANCTPHSYVSPIRNTSRIKATGNTTVGLNGNTSVTDWTTVNPLFMVLELVSRADTAFPDPEYVIKPGLSADKMMYCGGEMVNNRIHYFGGIASTSVAGLAASTRHISFDLNGENEQVHAPMPVGVYKQVTWTHNNKIYSFGGVTAMDTTQWGYQGLYNGVQVWEDNGTAEGLWTELTTNVTYGFDSCGTVYYDSDLNKNLILIMGGYNTMQPGIANKYYYADITTFDGTFSQADSYLGNLSGGGVLKEYDNELIFALPTRLSNAFTNSAYRIRLPINPPSPVFAGGIVTQGTELGTGKGGKMHVWRDTLLLFPEVMQYYQDRDFYFYQWAPNESRWLKVTVQTPADFPYSTSYIPAVVFNGGRVYALCTNAGTTQKLLVIDLIDPVDSPLLAIDDVTTEVSRLYPPYAQVTR